MDGGLAVTLGLLSVLALTWYIWRKRRMSLLERLGIPGPKPHLITGNVNDTSNQAELSLEWEKKYGKTYGIYLGAWPFIITSDPEFLKLVQIKEFRSFPGRAGFLADLAMAHSIAKDGIFAEKGERWKNSRSAISPAFSTGKLKRMMPIVKEATNIFLEKIAEQGNKTFDIIPLFRSLSFDINCRASFGIATNVQNEDNSLFVRSVYRSFDADVGDILAKSLLYFPELHPLPQLIRMTRDKIRMFFNSPSLLAVIRGCTQIIKKRKENPQAARPDLLQSLIDASKDVSNDTAKKDNSMHVPLTDNEVLANSVGFMLAGFEAVSTFASFCIRYLVEHPKVQDKLREEIQTHVKGEVDYEVMNELRYLEQVTNETMRLFPFSATGINREATEDFKYKDIYVPKGMCVGIALHALNMNPDFWEKPQEFNPDRFSPEKEINGIVYQPFGNGPRNCVGMRFAQVIMKTILATLLLKYKFYNPPDAEPFELEHNVFLVRPKNGVQVRAIPL